MQAIVAIKDLKFNVLNTSDKIKLILIIGSSTVVSYFSYFTLKIYLDHRKYKHIPGPPNHGYLTLNLH
jgi:hypothetical protein